MYVKFYKIIISKILLPSLIKKNSFQNQLKTCRKLTLSSFLANISTIWLCKKIFVHIKVFASNKILYETCNKKIVLSLRVLAKIEFKMFLKALELQIFKKCDFLRHVCIYNKMLDKKILYTKAYVENFVNSISFKKNKFQSHSKVILKHFGNFCKQFKNASCTTQIFTTKLSAHTVNFYIWFRLRGNCVQKLCTNKLIETYQSQYDQSISNHRQHKNNSIQRYLNPPGFVPLWYTRTTPPGRRSAHQRNVLFADVEEHRRVPIKLIHSCTYQ